MLRSNEPTYRIADAIRPIYPNRWSSYFRWITRNRFESVNGAATFIRPMSTRSCKLLVRHLYEWCSGLMNRGSFHWSRSWINKLFFHPYIVNVKETFQQLADFQKIVVSSLSVNRLTTSSNTRHTVRECSKNVDSMEAGYTVTRGVHSERFL